MLFSVFSQRGGEHQHLKVSSQMFLFEALLPDLAAEAFTQPHLLIPTQYSSPGSTWEDIHCRSCLWTALVRLINEFPSTHCSGLPDAPVAIAPFDFSCCGVLGLGFSSSAALDVLGAASVPQARLICSQQTRHGPYPPLEKPTQGAGSGPSLSAPLGGGSSVGADGF